MSKIFSWINCPRFIAELSRLCWNRYLITYRVFCVNLSILESVAEPPKSNVRASREGPYHRVFTGGDRVPPSRGGGADRRQETARGVTSRRQRRVCSKRSRHPPLGRRLNEVAVAPCLYQRPFACRRTKSLQEWWARLGLNQRPLRCEHSALPLSYAPAQVAW